MSTQPERPDEGASPAPLRAHPHDHRDHLDCSQIVLRVFEYIDKETAPDDTARIKSHLDGCSHCLDEYERDLLLKALVRRSCSGQSAPGELRTRILSRLTTVTVQTGNGGAVSRERIAAVEVLEEAVDGWDPPNG